MVDQFCDPLEVDDDGDRHDEQQGEATEPDLDCERTVKHTTNHPIGSLQAGVNVLVLLACVLQLSALVMEGTENVSAGSL